MLQFNISTPEHAPHVSDPLHSTPGQPAVSGFVNINNQACSSNDHDDMQPSNEHIIHEKQDTSDSDDVISDDSDDERVIDCPTEMQCSYCGKHQDQYTDTYACSCGRKVCQKCKGLDKRHWRQIKRMKFVENPISKAYWSENCKWFDKKC